MLLGVTTLLCKNDLNVLYGSQLFIGWRVTGIRMFAVNMTCKNRLLIEWRVTGIRHEKKRPEALLFLSE